MPQCTPTRAALLTGQHTARNKMWHVIGWYGYPWAPVLEPAFREHLPRDTFTLARGLKAAGYVTGIAGKWHLTNNEDGNYTSLNPRAGNSYGFDYVAPRGEGSQNEGDKWVDHLTDETLRFIERHRERPWFFYLSHHTLHGKISAPPDLVKKHLNRGAPEAGLHNATYLAAIEHLDNSIGRLTARLEALDLRKNTMIVFLSDNGGEDTSYALPAWSDDAPDGSRPLKARSQSFDNAPLREGKGSPYEGGIRVPCLVSWPGVVQPGAIISTPIHVVDWMPTLLDAATGNPSLPSHLNHLLDGVSLLPLLNGGSIASRPLFWYLPLYDLRWAATPCAVIREGDWKLIHYFGDWFDSTQTYHRGGHIELYNLASDIGETRDLSSAQPERATALKQRLNDWMRSIPAVIPEANPHTDPAKIMVETKEKQAWNR